MAIALAVQRGKFVYVYDENNHLLFFRAPVRGPMTG